MHIARSLSAAVALVMQLFGPPNPSQTAEPITADPATTPVLVFDGLAGDLERAEWAFEQFSAANMDFPNLELRFSSDPQACAGNAGLHRSRGAEHLVSICNSDQARRHLTVLHELAHVWAADNVDDSTRSAFLEARGLRQWNGTDVAWENKGTEHAAEIIAWGVNNRPCRLVPRAQIGERDLNDLSAQFELLTGSSPLCDATPSAAASRPSGQELS